MGTDVERIVRHFWSIHEAWAGPVDVAIGVFLLARQLGITSLIPAVISLSMVPCQTLSHHTLIKYQLSYLRLSRFQKNRARPRNVGSNEFKHA